MEDFMNLTTKKICLSWKTSHGHARILMMKKTTADSKSKGKNMGYTRNLHGQ